MQKKKKTSAFKYGYFVYLCALIVLSLFSIVYVKTLLNNYEDSQPERLVESKVDSMITSARDGTLWESYAFPSVEYSEFDKNTDLRQLYTDALAYGDVTYTVKQGAHTENGIVYNVVGEDHVMAEIALTAIGEPITKLAVFTIQDWEISSVEFKADSKDYKIDAPNDFSVWVNGIALDSDDVIEDKGGTLKYAVYGLHGKPNIEIKDPSGIAAEYKIAGTTVKTVFYDYSLTLPSSLTVTLNGQAHAGEVLGDGNVQHDIRMLEKPNVTISDMYGNTFEYDGGNKLPLTYIKITAPTNYTVTVDGVSVPKDAVTLSENPEYEHFREYVENLPYLALFDISVLKDDSDISVKDANGVEINYDKNAHTLDLTEITSDTLVPDDISAEVDVLKVAKDWSLMMSKDLAGAYYGFSNYAANLIEGSYLYEVARKWVNSIDITFTSIHTLLDPPFTNEIVKNFTWITDDCFSVDISFDKHMLLSSGMTITDSMNSRFHFVKYDGTSDWVYNPTWKLVNIKEIVE